MAEKILSIIVPSYNTSSFVQECVPTFIDERLFNDVDVFFIDDGATDNTEQTLRPFLEKYPDYFHFCHKENGGHGSVINYGLSKCVKTKYFKVIDGDDFVDREALINLVSYLKTTNDDLVVSGYLEKYPNGETKIPPITMDDNSSYKERTTYGPELLIALNLTIHSATFKTSIFVDNQIVMPEKLFFEDNLFILYPTIYLKAISFINDYVYCYRLGNPNQSVSIAGRIKHYQDSLVVRDLAHRFLASQAMGTCQCIKDYCIKRVAQSLSCYQNTLLYYKDNKLAREKCHELYLEDIKNPQLLDELKKQKFHRYLFASKFRFICLFRMAVKKNF